LSANLSRSPLVTPLPPRRFRPEEQAPPNVLLALTSKPPFFQQLLGMDWQPRRKYAQDFQQPSFQTIGIPSVIPTTAVPRAPYTVPLFNRARLQPDPVPNSLLTLLAKSQPANPPFIPPQLPEIYKAKGNLDYQELEVTVYLQGSVILPYFPPDLPAFHVRARATPQDFFFQTTQIGQPKPFHQDDWPLFARKTQPHLDYTYSGITTRGIPAGIQLPFSLTDWPTPQRKKYTFLDIPPNVLLSGIRQNQPFGFYDWPQTQRPKFVPGEAYPSPQIVLTTKYPEPFYQTEWPLPLRARKLSEDHVWSGWTTRAPKTIPSGFDVMPNLFGMNYLEAIYTLQVAGIYIPKAAYFFGPSQITVKWVDVGGPGGLVQAQSIAAGLLVKPGTKLTLTVSNFPFSSSLDPYPDWYQRN
jgi:hypothetical protein